MLDGPAAPRSATATGVATLKTARAAACERAWTIATSGWPRSAVAISCVSAVAPAIGAHARPWAVAARPLEAEAGRSRQPAAGVDAHGRAEHRVAGDPRQRLQRERGGLPGDRADEAGVGGRRATGAGGSHREAESVADVRRADDAAALRHPVENGAVRAHRVAPVPLVGVGDLPRAGPPARGAEQAGALRGRPGHHRRRGRRRRAAGRAREGAGRRGQQGERRRRRDQRRRAAGQDSAHALRNPHGSRRHVP